MTELTYLYAAIAVLAGVISSISIWAPRRLGLKLGAIGASGLFLPAAYLGFAALLGQPKPVRLEWWLGHAKKRQPYWRRPSARMRPSTSGCR